MPFTAQELASIANGVLDFNIKGQPLLQTIQEKPLLDKFFSMQKTFGAAKEFISGPVKGTYTGGFMGFSGDDTLAFTNPSNLKRWNYSWYEVFKGISFTGTELKKGGISVTDTETGGKTSNHSDTEMTVLVDLLQDKIEDMMESFARGMNNMFWKDGAQDAKQAPGIFALLSETPTTGTVGGLSRASNTWWRNRVRLAIASDSSTYANQPLNTVMQQEVRQLRRFGGRPNFAPCGSDFLNALEGEQRKNGYFTQTGWAKNGGKIDISVADLTFKGIDFFYDPTLDDLGKSKYCYMIDLKHIRPYVMQGEDRKTHTPARPADKFVYYRGITWTGGLVADQMNCHGIYSIA